MRRAWLWPSIAVASLLLLGLLLAPGIRQVPGGENVADDGSLQTPSGTNVRQNMTDDNPTTPKLMNKRISDAALSVEGVQRAWGVILDNTALVGLDLDNSIKGTAVNETVAEVKTQVKELPNVTRVEATADSVLAEQIRRIADEIGSGDPVSQFADEIRQLISKIAPDGEM